MQSLEPTSPCVVLSWVFAGTCGQVHLGTVLYSLYRAFKALLATTRLPCGLSKIHYTDLLLDFFRLF